MYREKHGCNSMPPLRLPFNHKISTLLKEKQILTKKNNRSFVEGAMCVVAWLVARGVPLAHSRGGHPQPRHNFVSAGSLWAGMPPCGFRWRLSVSRVGIGVLGALGVAR